MATNHTVGWLADGTAQSYSTIAAAIAACSAGDTVTVYYASAKKRAVWSEATVINVAITLVAGVSRQRIIFSHATSLDMQADCTIDGFRFSAQGLQNSTGTVTAAIKNCAFVGIALTCSTSTLTATFTNCIFMNAPGVGLAVSNGTITVTHCAAINNRSYGFRRATAGTFNAYNCFAFGNPTADFNGTIAASSNCASVDGTHPTGGTPVNINTSDPIFWQNVTGDYTQDIDIRSDTTGSMATAGSDQAVDTDIWGRTRHATTPTIGPFEAWTLPTTPAANKIVTGTSCVLADGTTRDGSATEETHTADDFPDRANVTSNDSVLGEVGTAIEETHEQMAAPSAFTLTSSLDGLTHTINVTGPEGAVYVIHDASHNIVASGIDGEKVRGLTAGTNYHCHARK